MTISISHSLRIQRSNLHVFFDNIVEISICMLLESNVYYKLYNQTAVTTVRGETQS